MFPRVFPRRYCGAAAESAKAEQEHLQQLLEERDAEINGLSERLVQ